MARRLCRTKWKRKILPKSEKLIGEHGNNDFAKNLIDINKANLN